MTSPGANPTRAAASRLTAKQLREPRQLFRAQVCSPVHAFDELFGLFGQSRQLVEVRAENPHRQVRRCPPEPFVNTHAEGRREQHRDARESLEPLTHVVLDVFDAAASVGLQNDENVGECMWHRVFRALGSPSASHHILDLRHVGEGTRSRVHDRESYRHQRNHLVRDHGHTGAGRRWSGQGVGPSALRRSDQTAARLIASEPGRSARSNHSLCDTRFERQAKNRSISVRATPSISRCPSRASAPPTSA